MNLLKTKVIVAAATRMLENVIYWELQEDDYQAPGNRTAHELATHIVETNLVEVMMVFGRLVGRIEKGWQNDAGLVFHHMGLDEEQQEEALFRVFMSCSGEGISITDEFAEEFTKASDVLTKWTPFSLDATPMDFDAAESILSPLVVDWLIEKVA